MDTWREGGREGGMWDVVCVLMCTLLCIYNQVRQNYKQQKEKGGREML